MPKQTQRNMRGNVASLDEFLEKQKNSKLLDQHLRAVGDSLLRFLHSFADAAVKNVTPETKAEVEEVKKVLVRIERHYPKAIRKEERAQLEKKLDQILLVVAQT